MKTYLELNEIELMIEAATNKRDRLLIKVIFHLGCRVSEALGLSVQDIDFERRRVTIEHLKTRIKLTCSLCGTNLGKCHSFCPKCGGKIDRPNTGEIEHRRLRTLPLDKETQELLQDYIKRGGPVEKNGKLLIFGINRHRAWQIVKQCAEKSRLPKIVNAESGKTHNVSPHQLRDAFAVHAVKQDDSGDGLRLLQEHLGHASFNTTARYRKVSGKEHQVWYDKLWDKKNP